jgi:hypothetical protein
MRNIYLLAILLLFFFKANSQNPLQTKIDSMLVDIDQTDFTTGILYDRTVPWANLSSFNLENRVSNVTHFEQALFELHKATLEQKFLSIEQLRGSYVSKNSKTIVDIGIINAEFNKINYIPEDEANGSIGILNDKFEKLNNAKEPFLKNQVFIVSPLKKGVLGPQVRFQFNEQLFFEEVENKQLISIVGNFETNEDYTIYSNNTFNNDFINVEYSDSGYKVLTFTAEFSDGTTITTQSSIYIGNLSHIAPLGGTVDGEINATIGFQGYEESSSKRGHLEYRVYYRNGGQRLYKPIIIIDGFDPKDQRKFSDTDIPEIPADEHNSMEEFMTYAVEGEVDKKLIEVLNQRGFDVILVNHPNYTSIDGGPEIDGGADYIERNALTHVELYKTLNDSLTANNSNQKLVIVGPSMGGQISRYALAYMEANNMDHNTRLWISIDSPHLGANIPLGIQSLINQASSNNVAAEDFRNDYLGSEAARQQLIEQFNHANGNQLNTNYMNGKTTGQGFAENRGHPFYIEYYNNLFENGIHNNEINSRGYPINTRNIAIVNGSLKGNDIYAKTFIDSMPDDTFADDSEVGFNVRINYNFCPAPPIPLCFPVHLSSLESFTLPSIGTNNKVSRFKHPLSGDHSKYVTNNNSRGNMDNISGGWFPSYNDFAEPILGSDLYNEHNHPSNWSSFTWGNFLGEIYAYISNHFGEADIILNANNHVNSFIPTFSSLGFYEPDTSWTENLDRDLTCDNEIPFDTYFGPENNEQHTSFTPESVAWLFQELLGNEQLPTVYKDDESSLIEGPTEMCLDDLVTYNLEICAGPIPTWEVSNENLQIITSDENLVVVTTKNNLGEYYNDFGYIKAIYPNKIIEKEIWIGRPDNPGDLLGLDDVHYGSFNNYSVGPANGAEGYVWSLPEPFNPENDIVPYIDGTSDHWQMNPTNTITNNSVFSGNAGYEGEIRVLGTNSCGEGNYSWLEVTQYNSGPCDTCLEPLEVVPYPNSADVSFKLDFRQHGAGTYYIYIYDANANIIYQGESNNVEKTVNTQDIPAGTYYLHIHEGDKITYQQLNITR